MSENTDYEVFESEALEGRVYLQFLSGEIANQFKIECLGQMCHLKGRIRFVRRSRDVWSKFECTLEQAKMLSVCESDKAPPIPPSFTAVKCTVIRASDFPYHLPIENITMSLVNGDMCYESQQGAHNKKNMTLFKAEVTFRPLELITRPASMSGYSIEEVAFDKLTLFRGRLTIPRPFNLQVQVQVGTPPAVSARNNNNRNNHPLSPLHSTRSPVHGPRGLFAAPAPSLLRLPRALECFLFLLVVLCCLLFRSYHVTPETHNMYTMYTVVFVLSAALVIFSFRGLALQVLLRWASPQESNGRSFFVNGWNAWSFAGCVVQGAAPPVYSMPGMFVKAFHDGGVGTSLHINLGHGDAPLLPTVNNQGNGKVTWLPGWSHGSVLLKDETPLPLPLYKNTEPAIAARNPARDGIPVPQPILVGKPMCSEQVHIFAVLYLITVIAHLQHLAKSVNPGISAASGGLSECNRVHRLRKGPRGIRYVHADRGPARRLRCRSGLPLPAPSVRLYCHQPRLRPGQRARVRRWRICAGAHRRHRLAGHLHGARA